MNMNQLINMVTNQIIRRVVNIVVDKGFRFASRSAATVKTAAKDNPPAPAEIASADPQRDAQLRDMVEKAAAGAKLNGRIGG